MNESINVTGRVKAVLRDKNGKLKLALEQPNLVTTVGKSLIASLLADAAVVAPSHMAVGSSVTAPVVGNTTLGTELGRVALTSTTPVSNTVLYVATFGAGTGTGTVTEAGLFNATPAGTMMCHTLFNTAIPKGAGDSLEVTWTVTIS